MKPILILFIFITIACHVQAATDTLSLSRNEAIKIGLQNRFDVKANAYDVKIADSKIIQAKNNWFPEINGTANLKYSPQLQNSVIPGGVLPGFDQSQLIPLTVKSESVFGLNLSQPVFNIGLINEIKFSQINLAIQKEKNRAEEINISLQISQAYLNVQLRDLQKRVAADIATRNAEYAMIAEGMYKHGSLIENYYLRAILDRDNAKQIQKQTEQDYELSLMELYYQLNIPRGTNVHISDSLDGAEADMNSFQDLSGERTELCQLKLRQQEDQLALKNVNQSVMPSVYLGANYSQQFLSNRFNYGDGRWWSPFSYVTLNVNVPLSAHLKIKGKKREFKERIVQNELLLEQKKSDINYEIQQARTSFSNAVLNMRSTKSSYELSRTIFHNQQKQYKLGAFAYSELIDTEKTLSVTERNYIQSAYELMLARIKLQKATNNF
ncbi:outer membrane protein TolC [Pedobacter cryoconitis]|uniref:Outer membrane protein TolC n=1 Tax=Pedobacter cryoconitis TaxID=188932 RepID=A0A7W8ZRI8_9SPHI|nr:TolC family protein [Pedobacter cryoconitis]MBB5638898.1 outer membrane protein TolC [Pedobacter cryoconitis]